MTTNLNRSQSKTRERHSSDPVRRTSRPASEDSSMSADDIRETVKEAVGKGVAAVAGAVEGIDETMQETHLADTAESAIHQVGDTANKVVRAAKEETANLQSALHGEASSSPTASSGSSRSGTAETEDDWSTERDDPTFGTTPTEANTSGSPLAFGASDEDVDEAEGLCPRQGI